MSGNWINLIIILIFILSAAGPAIAKALKWLQEQRAKENAWRDQMSGSSDLEDIAAQRRQELQQKRQRQIQVQQRQARPQRDFSAEVAGQAPVELQQPAQPGNMTMAERIARAKAKAEYQKRSRQLREQQSRESPQRMDPQAQAEQQARAQAEREAEAAQRAARHRQQQQQARQQSVQRQRRLQQQQQRQAAALAKQRAQAEAAEQHQREKTLREQGQARRQRVAAEQAAAAIRENDVVGNTQIRQRLFNRRSLREAIVLREILDRPVSLRDNASA